jgi:protein involved in polysaccharide export with SLBB domain
MKNYSMSLTIAFISFLIQTVLVCPLHEAIAQDPNTNTSFHSEINNNGRMNAFSNLSLKEKKEFFTSLGEEDRSKLFMGLSAGDKKDIFESLDDKEKQELLQKHPDLPALLKGKEILPAPVAEEEKPPEKPLPRSRLEKVLSGQFPTDISRELSQYGYDFFRKEISTFAPVTNVPVGAGYIIGPGDNFTIHLWGKAEKSYDVSVTRDGGISVPRLGTLNVSGLTFSELKRFLFGKFKEYYPDFEMSITMGRLRSVDIFVVGEANHPGTYSVSSLSTVISVLYSAGGPSKNGSLRKLMVLRHGKVITTLDLYEFFIKGMKKNDLRLQTGDTIFIPVIGPVVGVSGNVRRPAIYELKESETLGEVIRLAGGVLPFGYLHNVVIERIKGHQRRVIKSFNLDPAFATANENLTTPLKDGDLIKIYPVHEKIRQVVYLEGHVKYPREYELKPGMMLRDIITSYDDLLPEPYLARAEIIRLMPPDLHPEVIQFNLNKLLAGDKSQNIQLQDFDRVIIYEVWDKEQIPEVSISGDVRFPGKYRLYKGMKVSDLIFQAGNLKNTAYLDKATLSRVVPGEGGTDIIKIEFSPGKAMDVASQDNLPLERDDFVTIREIPQYSEALKRKIYLEGEFRFPGEYTFSENERLSSVIERAGGLTEEGYPFGATFIRGSAKAVQKERLKEYIDKLEKDILTVSTQAAETALDKEEAAILKQTMDAKKQLLDKLKTSEPTGRMVINLTEVLHVPSSEYDLELRPGDRLIVDKRPDHVNVMGEVYNPTALLSLEGKNVEYYLNQVGGVTDRADEDQIYLVRANGSVFSKSQEGFFGSAGWDSENNRWALGGFEALTVNPGDTIIVPQELEKYPWLRVVKDVTQIMYQIAVAAGIFILAN